MKTTATDLAAAGYGIGTVKVRYSCEGCAATRREVTVRARGAAESVTDWMAHVVDAISIDHAQFHCAERHADIEIPLAANKPLGSRREAEH